MITNGVAMDVKVDWESKYKAYARRRCEDFSGTERKMLEKLADVVVQKGNPKRYELVAQFLEKIYKHSNETDKWYNFLETTGSLLTRSA